MDWNHVFVLMISNFCMVLLASKLSKKDRLESQKNFEEHRKEVIQIMKSIEEEMKDFHKKILRIERDKK